MNIVVFSFTAAAAAVSVRLYKLFHDEHIASVHETVRKFVPAAPGILRPFPLNLQESARQAFQSADVIIFIGAAAIAVRTSAPLLQSKEKDPAVLVVDEHGRYVIPILSGHMGGANSMARWLAEKLGGQAVITTATDINGLFAVDEWTARQGLKLSSLDDAKFFSAALLERGQAGLYSEFPLEEILPPSLTEADRGPLGIAVTVKEKCRPFAITVTARPPILHIGIGCRQGMTADHIGERVEEEMQRLGLSWEAVADVSTIDFKRREEGLTQFAARRQLPIRYYSARQLNKAPGRFMASHFVRRIAGTDNVCGRAAVLASHGGRLLLEKSGCDGVTVAIACENYTVRFGGKEEAE